MTYTWTDYGDTSYDWNVGTSRDNVFSSDGYGRFLPTPDGSCTWITAQPMIVSTYKKQKGWNHGNDVEMVIVFNFILPNGEIVDNQVNMEVKEDSSLNPKIQFRGISPMQMKICFYKSVAYLEGMKNETV
jgi:hypothetical protein